ncbi:MAG: hypothetical protein HY323_07200 [Betaproteobacteria bacterium]|nr:hypothetical protein [Betaproteobacteria bacterium]
MDTTYAIYSSAFHGGGREGAHYSERGYLFSRHRSEAAAIRHYRSWIRGHGDCRCGAPILIVEYTGAGRRAFLHPRWPDDTLPDLVERHGSVTHNDRTGGYRIVLD